MDQDGRGTVFEITSSGSLTSLYSFTGANDGADPLGCLAQGTDGNLYGTTYSGGANGYGTAFQITPNGVLTTLYSFAATSDGTNNFGAAYPNGTLVAGTDGKFYGTTYGTSSGGVFQAALQGIALPMLTPQATSSVGPIEATLNGAVNSNGNDTHAYFEYGSVYGVSYSGTTPVQDIGSGTNGVLVSASLSVLQPNTTYHFQLVTVEPNGVSYGPVQTFTTSAYEPPTITYPPPVVSKSSAALSPTVNPNGIDTKVEILWGLTMAYTNNTPLQDIGGGLSPVVVNATLNGLSSGTTYHYSVMTYNSLGTVAGPDEVFTTPVAPGYFLNDAVVTGSSVTLSANVNPNGFAGPSTNKKNVLVSWQYGLVSGSYTKVTAAQPIGTGTSALPVSLAITKSALKPVVYHYQLVISSTVGYTYGPDQTFSVEPPALAYSAPASTGTDATLLVTVNPNGNDTMVSVRYGLTTAYTSGTISVGDIGSGSAPVSVDPDLTGLAPDTAYYYQVDTTNALGTVYGPAQEFTTQPLFGTAPVVYTKEDAPGIVGAVFSVLGNPIINDFDQTAFQATVTGSAGSGITSSNNSGIWAGIGTDGLTLIAQTGASAPDYTGTSTVGTFAKLSDPVYADSDAVAFLGTLAKTGTVTTSNDTGIWATTSGTTNGPLVLVARAGDPAPDLNGATSPGSPVFASFAQFVLPDQGGAVILAKLVSGTPASPAPGGVVTADSEGIWAVGNNGILTQIIRTGNALNYNGKVKIISTLAIFNAPTASTGQTRHFNNFGNLIYKVGFTDGTTGFVQSVFP